MDLQVVLESVGMFTDYAWVWGGLGFLAGCYLLLVGLVCGGFAFTPVSLLCPAPFSLLAPVRCWPGVPACLLPVWAWRAPASCCKLLARKFCLPGYLQSPVKVATVAEASKERGASAEAAEAGAAVPRSSSGASDVQLAAAATGAAGERKQGTVDGAEGGAGSRGEQEQSGPSAALNIPFTPMTLVFK